MALIVAAMLTASVDDCELVDPAAASNLCARYHAMQTERLHATTLTAVPCVLRKLPPCVPEAFVRNVSFEAMRAAYGLKGGVVLQECQCPR